MIEIGNQPGERESAARLKAMFVKAPSDRPADLSEIAHSSGLGRVDHSVVWNDPLAIERTESVAYRRNAWAGFVSNRDGAVAS